MMNLKLLETIRDLEAEMEKMRIKHEDEKDMLQRYIIECQARIGTYVPVSKDAIDVSLG